jgi:hypothetical protein
MATIKISEAVNRHRRRFFGTAAMTIAAAQLGMIGSADAQSSKTNMADVPAIKPGSNTSFGSLKQIDAGVLNVGYASAQVDESLFRNVDGEGADCVAFASSPAIQPCHDRIKGLWRNVTIGGPFAKA